MSGEVIHGDCLEIMRPLAGRIRAVFHCFVGDLQAAQAFFDLGCLVSLTGIVTFKKAEELRETIRSLPPEKIMIETDCPYLPPQSKRGQRNDPSNIPEIATTTADILGISLAALAGTTTQNTRDLFKF